MVSLPLQRGYWMALCLMLLFPKSALNAQVVELSGGTSTLYEAQGASLTFRNATFEGGVSGGRQGGQFLSGSYIRHTTPTAAYTVGMQELRFSLPTDLFSGQHRLAAVGLGVVTQRRGTGIEAFAGEGSTRRDSPYVQGFSQLKPMAALLLTRPLSSHLTLSAQLLSASSSTALTSLEWRPQPSMRIAASGGSGGNHHYAAGSFEINSVKQTIQAEYISAGQGFHRTGSQPDLSPEFIHENLSYVFRSSALPRFTLSAARQNFVDVYSGSTSGMQPISTVDQLSATQQIAALRLNAALFHSSYTDQSNIAYTVSGAFPVTHRIEVQNSFFDSHLLGSSKPHSRSLVTNFREQLSNRISVSQTINTSGGQTSAGFGGSLQMGCGSFSVESQTIYVPTRPDNPFQQTLMMDFQLTVFGKVLLHVGSFISPTGKLLYTADARAVQSLFRGARTTTEHSNLGNSLLRGRVVDESGAPVVGAALEIDGKLIFTDSEGTFFLRERKPTLHRYNVALKEFLDGQNYRVLSEPMQLASSRASHAPVTIVVARVN